MFFIEDITKTITEIRIAFENASPINQLFSIFILLCMFIISILLFIINLAYYHKTKAKLKKGNQNEKDVEGKK